MKNCRASLHHQQSLHSQFQPGPTTWTISVETQDLLACPSWRWQLDQLQSSQQPFFRRVLRIRERWSYRVVSVRRPLNPSGFRWPDFHNQYRMLSYWRCKSTVFWEVVGPDELMATLRGSNDGRCLPWVNGGYFDASVVESDPWKIYLCQHEIRGN